jgi:hypothetical protein
MDTALQKQLHEGGGEDGIVHPVYNAQQEGLMAFYPKDWRVVVLMLLIILVRSPVQQVFASVGISVLLVVFASVSALLSHLSISWCLPLLPPYFPISLHLSRTFKVVGLPLMLYFFKYLYINIRSPDPLDAHP